MRRRRDGAGGRDAQRPHAAVRLPQRRVRHLQGQDPGGRSRLRRAPGVDADRGREAGRTRALLLREAAHRPRDRGARSAPRGRHPDQAPPVPDRVDREGRARRRDRPVQAARERAAPVPGRPVHRLPAEGRQAPQLLARDAAARRQPARDPRPAHPGRILQRRAVHAVQGTRDPALRGAARRVLPARGIGQADRVRRGRHRVRADQGDDRARAASRDRPRDGAVLGRARAARSLPAGPPRPVAVGAPQLHVHPGAVGAARRRRVAGPYRLRAPGGDGRFPGPVGLPGVRVRRAGDDRRGAARLHAAVRAAGDRVLRGQLHVRGGIRARGSRPDAGARGSAETLRTSPVARSFGPRRCRRVSWAILGGGVRGHKTATAQCCMGNASSS